MFKTKWLDKQRSPRSEPKKRSGIIQRLGARDTSAVNECAAIYGEYVSELAKYNSHSAEEAANVAAKIFDDINEFARSENGVNCPRPEIDLIRQIAVRRIVKQGWDGRKV